MVLVDEIEFERMVSDFEGGSIGYGDFVFEIAGRLLDESRTEDSFTGYIGAQSVF